MTKLIRKALWKIIPNTMYEIWRDAHERGRIEGRDSYQRFIEKNLREHDVSDFDEPGLILGYNHAIKAMRGELTEVV